MQRSIRTASWLVGLLLVVATAVPAQLTVTPYTLPAAGEDEVEITMEETYEVTGVGTDTVVLEGTLITRRSEPLWGHSANGQSWSTSTVVAEFVSLDLSGTSTLFGPVEVSLDPDFPTFAAVTAGDCSAATSVVVAMPALGLTLKTASPVQLRSTVDSVPPVGDTQTVSVNAPIVLVDDQGRAQGELLHARVLWRDLVTQTQYASVDPAPVGEPAATEDQLARQEATAPVVETEPVSGGKAPDRR